MATNKKLWGGRFSQNTDSLMEIFSESVSYDWRLYHHDIQGSIAHARMLSAVGVLTHDEFHSIEVGLREIEAQIDAGEFKWRTDLEDVHMNIESALTEKIGIAGKKLHTGRSRNDQIATDVRLFLREKIDEIADYTGQLQMALIDYAKQQAHTIMPGMTHTQSAQPVTFGHHLLAWNEMLQRDYERLMDCRKRVNICPLGSAALAGTSYPIDRQMTAHELNFSEPTHNSLDAVSDRDFVMEFNAVASIMMVHLSRFAEELVLWSSEGFNFVDIGDQFSTGSSIMPQKKNPDMAELTRGKCGRVIGDLVAILTQMKAQPLAYNRDMQEDKEPLFDAVDTLLLCLQVFVKMVPGMIIKPQNMRLAAEKGFATATDLADYLVRKNVAFRDAHEIVGKIVAYALEHAVQLQEIELAKLKQFGEMIEEDVYAILTLEGSVAARNHIGGTAPSQVEIAANHALARINARV